MNDIDRKAKIRRFLTYTAVSIVISGLIFGLMLIFVNGTTYVDIMDSLLVAGVLVFSIGWMLYVTNVGIFSLFAYGTQRFFAALLKRRHRTYEEMVYNRPKVDMLIIISFWVGGFIVFLASMVMYLIYYNYII